jgi:predicted dehydrogenase
MSLKVAVCGLGFMGRTHLAAYAAARAAGCSNRLVAVADSSPERRAGRLGAGGNLKTGEERAAFDPAEVRGYADPEQLARDPEVELVSLCTPTPTHLPLAELFLRAGKHVLVEKPVALEARRIEALAEVARRSGRLCMPAHCMRFWPGWSELRAAIAAGRLGRLRSATFRRLASRPDWSPGFYGDAAQTGGALFDLHVHDADFVRWCLGEPRGVVAHGSRDHLLALYRFDGLPLVAAEGGWDLPPSHRFEMAYEVVGERQTWRYELGAAGPELEIFDAAAASDAAPQRPVLAAATGYELEVRALLAAIAAGGPAPVTLEDAAGTARLLEAVARALDS